MQASELQREQLKKQMDQLAAAVQASEAQGEQLRKQLASVREAATKESDGLKAKIAALEKDLAQKLAQIQSLQEKKAELQKKPETAIKPPEKPAP